MVEFKALTTSIETYYEKGIPNTFVFGCKVPEEIGFSFKAGQFAMLSVDGYFLPADKTKLKWSAFSIASSPLQKNYLEFCVRAKDYAGVSYGMAKLGKNENLNVKAPFGHFFLKENTNPKVFIAIGTGIAPLISMIRTLALSKNWKEKTELLFGFRTRETFVYKKELDELEKNFPNFKVIPIASREDESWKGEKGHVQDLLKKHNFYENKSTEYYICGNPPAVTEIIQILCEKEIGKEQINYEKW